MYLHLGQDTVVRSGEIIGIFDIENTSVSRLTRDFLKKAETGGRVRNVSYDLPKSFILCGTRRETRVYITPISTATLKKRAGSMEELDGAWP